MKTVVVIDYEGSNLFSVMRAFEHLGLKVKVSSSPTELLSAEAAVLPGVGAFGAAIERLQALGLVSAIHRYTQSEKPFLGICLGMQLLFSSSEEFGTHTGLDILKGEVKKFPSINCSGDKIRVPQIGWNKIERPKHLKNWDKTPLSGLEDGSFMYFVHSFYCSPENQELVTSTTEYAGLKYCSSIQFRKTFAAQFHPEKSSELGLSIYKNWAKQSGII